MPYHSAEVLEPRRLLAAVPAGEGDAENTPPAVVVNAERYVAFGREFTVTGSVADADGDGWIATADFGDGSPVFSNGSSGGTFVFGHAYARLGTYTLTVTVTDDRGAATAVTRPVTAVSLAGRVFHDTNDDGLRSATGADPPVSGQLVFLDHNENGRVDSSEPRSVTDENGVYTFTLDNVPPDGGRYAVWHVPPAGWRHSTPPFARVPVWPQLGNTRDFGLTQRSRISGSVFHDFNANGVRDPNDFLVSEAVPYVDLDDDGFQDAAEPIGQFRQGGSQETYAFSNLEPGTYTMRLGTPPFGAALPTWPTSYPGHLVMTAPGGGGNAAWVVTVGRAEAATGHHFGVMQPQAFATFRLFRDDDRDGAIEAGEPIVIGRAVYVDADDDGALDPDERRVGGGPNAQYMLGLRPGTYKVRQVLPPGWVQTAPAGDGAHVVTVTAETGMLPRLDFGSAPAAAGATVVARHVFYNNSILDGRSAAVDARDEWAIAMDKRALLPGGGPGGFENLTSYSRGINGVMVDVLGLPPINPGRVPTAADFEFAVGPGGDPASATWSTAPAPSVVRVTGGGEHGSSRVTITWPDGAVRNTWLRVVVKANERTGLSEPDVFYFGNLVGETGDAASPTRVSALDLAAVRRAMAQGPVPLSVVARQTSRVDFNRDGRVNALDVAAARSGFFRSLRPIPAPPSPAPASRPPALLRDGEATEILA